MQILIWKDFLRSCCNIVVIGNDRDYIYSSACLFACLLVFFK